MHLVSFDDNTNFISPHKECKRSGFSLTNTLISFSQFIEIAHNRIKKFCQTEYIC